MEENQKNIANFLFEVGSMRYLPRMHRQTLMINDDTDNIASHSYRVALISWFLAKEEGVDPYKTVMMALIHDLGEARSGDHNWVSKRYVKIFEAEIAQEQLHDPDLKHIHDEYAKRESKESLVAKDADLLDEILLLKEYEWQGNKEATVWLHGKGNDTGNAQLKFLKTESGKKLGEMIYTTTPSEWWNTLWTNKNR